MFASPVRQAIIRAHGEPFILGDFRVTATFGQIDADHLTPHQGVDIGDGKCGEDLLAMATGRITLAGYLGAALVVRGISDAHPDHEWAIAHCASLTVKKGELVTVGQKVGVLGQTGANACHAHLGHKELRNGLWVETDIWLLLNQNSPPEGDDVLKGTWDEHISNRKASTFQGARFRSEPSIAAGNATILATFDAGVLVFPIAKVVGDAAGNPKTTGWYVAIMDTGGVTSPDTLGYFHESTLSPLTPIEQSGHTDAELAQARLDGAAESAAKWKQWLPTHP